MYKVFTKEICNPPDYIRKFLLIMKITTILIFAMLMQVSAAGFAQKITLNQKGVSLKQIFNEINKQTGYNILWSAKKIKNNRLQDVQFTNVSVEQALTKCLEGFSLTYAIEDKTIVIREKEKANQVPAEQPAEQRKNITGKVTDEAGNPIPGASVVIKGTTKGAVTQNDGSFSIEVNAGDVIQVSFMGFSPAEITISNQTSLRVVLKEATNDLTGVVVTALGIKKDLKTLSYNVQEVSGNEINKVKDANFVNSLVGKVAGVTINSSSSGVGGAARVVMRGTKSISGNNNALYVVDGIPVPSLSSTQPTDVFTGMGQSGDGISNINPEDIETISILSGPSAAALYGSEAANGVVMITTKKGAKNSFSLSASNTSNFQSPFVMPRFQNTYGSDPGNYYSWGEKLITPSNYNPKDFFQTGVNVTNTVSLSTGNDKNQTYVSLAAVNADGIINNNKLDRYNLSFRNTSKFLNDKLDLDLGMMYTNVQEQNMLSQGQYFNPLIPIYLFPRGDEIVKYQTYERYDPTRNFKTQFWPFGDMGLQMQNPYWITERDLFQNSKNRLQISASLKYTINDWINLTGRVRSDRNTAVNERNYYASTSGLFAGQAGAYYKYDFSTNQIYSDAMVNINKKLKDFSLTANIGASLQDIRYDDSSFGGNLQSVPNLFTFGNINLSQAKTSQSGYHDQTQAVFGNTQVGYKGLVYLDLSARNDWVSALANTKAKSIFYPSVGLSSVLTDVFKMESNVLSFLKARVSYSEVGNAPQRFISILTFPIVEGYPQTSSYLPATDLEPERTKSFEAGLNMMFWKGKVKLDVTAYQSSTFNQLFNPTLSTSSGYSSFYVNAGKIDNRGIELSLGVNQKIGPVSWNSNLVYSLNRNKIKELLPAYTNAQTGETVSLDSLDAGGTTSYKMSLVKGGSMGDIYVNTLKTDEHGFIIVDLASQGVKEDQNRFVKAGNSNPDFTLGFRNGFAYKNFNFDFLVTARIGGVGVSVTQAIMDNFGVSEASAQARDNGGALVNGYKIPARQYYQTIGGGTSGIGSMYVYSATNVRLSELSLGYDFPISKFYKAIKGLRLSVTGRNLFMFYNKAPFDPESTANTGTYYQGIDYFMQPSLRTVGFSAKVQF